MNRAIFIVLVFICLLAYANKAMDELIDPDVIVKPQDPAITSIIEKMDEAKDNGDIALFRQLLKEYKELNPPIEIVDGPQLASDVSNFKSKWSGNDIEVDSSYDYQEFSMDTRDDSLIYIVASRASTSGADNIISIFYSNDGITWYGLFNLSWGAHDLLNPSLKIVETPDTDYLFIAMEGMETSSPYNADIVVGRYNLVSSSWIFYYPANNASIDEKDPSLDADDVVYPTIPYLHLAFESEDSIAYMRSLDRGATWVDRAILGPGNPSWDYYDPSLAYGPSSPNADSMNLGVAWTYYQVTPGLNKIRFKRNRYKGQSADWLGTEYFTSPANNFDDRPSLKMTHGVTNSATIVFARRDTTGTDEEDLCNFYTYDAGRTWDEDVLYSGGPYEVLNTLSLDDTPNDYHVFFKGDYDDIRYKEAHYDDFSSSGWTFSTQISDGGNISDVSSPASAVMDTMPCVCWKTWAPGWKLMFNALWFPAGVEEDEFTPTTAFHLNPNPSNGMATLSYSLLKEGIVKISIYDISGRLIRNLIDETKEIGKYTIDINNKNLSSGIYFLHIITPDGKYTKSMTVVK